MKIYEKHRRTMLKKAPCTDALIWSCAVSRDRDISGKPIIAMGPLRMYASLSLHFTNTVTIHMELDPNKPQMEMYNKYMKKIERLHDVLSATYHHLNENRPTATGWQGWLNGTDTPGYGSSLIIDIPADQDAFCVFDMTDCYRKHRMTVRRKDLLVFVKKLLKHVNDHIKELLHMKEVYRTTK